jgi:ATP-dependent exoDNAse (exonuclease V) beta subunit
VAAELRDAAAEELRREEAEAIRVAYVAATRSRDLLVAPVCGDRPLEGWLSTLDPMLYPAGNARSTSMSAPGCPDFGTDSVLDRGPKGAVPSGGPVRPGLHHPAANGPPLVWWDPSTLVIEVDEPVPLRHQRILEADEEGAAGASEAAYAAWLQQREALRVRASAPSLIVKTVTSLSRAAAPIPDSPSEGERGDGSDAAPAPLHPEVQVAIVERGETQRPAGRRFGALVHAMLATIDLDADEAAIQASAALQQRMFDATQEEIRAAVVTVATALRHPLLRAAARADRANIRRETPVLLTLEDGTLAEGVVDLGRVDGIG